VGEAGRGRKRKRKGRSKVEFKYAAYMKQTKTPIAAIKSNCMNTNMNRISPRFLKREEGEAKLSSSVPHA
jgi:hypothetical protein